MTKRAMQRYVLRTALAGSMSALSISIAAATECQVFNAETNESLSGTCAVDYKDDATEISLGEKTLVFKQSARQGQWAVGTLDGKPAVRYEINRVTYSYSTLDLTLVLDQAD
jgi:hypothetical protein